jgi:hypothetical protein
MAYESSAEERILMVLKRIEQKLDKLDVIEKKVKAIEQDAARVRRAVKG